MEDCKTYKIEKDGKDMDLTIRIKQSKGAKELRVGAITLPPGSDATAELIRYDNYNLMLLGIPTGADGTNGNDGNDAELTSEQIDSIIEQIISSLPAIVGNDGRDGIDGSSITITDSTTDLDGNTLLTFSDGSVITINKGDTGEIPEIDCEVLRGCCCEEEVPPIEKLIIAKVRSHHIMPNTSGGTGEGSTPAFYAWEYGCKFWLELEALSWAACEPCDISIEMYDALRDIALEVFEGAITTTFSPGLGPYEVPVICLDPNWLKNIYPVNLRNALFSRYRITTLEEFLSEDFIRTHFYPNYPDCY